MVSMTNYLPCSHGTGDNPFGVRATAKAAAIIEAYPTKISSGKELAKLQGIGKATVTKVSLDPSSKNTFPFPQAPFLALKIVLGPNLRILTA